MYASWYKINDTVRHVARILIWGGPPMTKFCMMGRGDPLILIFIEIN